MKASAQRRRADRPTKQATPGARVPLSLRVSPEVKSVLDAATARSGRSRSQEAELALEASLGDRRRLLDLLDFIYGKEAAGLMLLIGELAGGFQDVWNRVIWHRDSNRSLSDPWLFGHLRTAIDDALTRVAPPGEQVKPDWKRTAAADFGEPFATEVLDRVGHTVAGAVLRSVFETKREADREAAIRARLPWVAP
jgi:hypothetical protein